VNLLLDSHAALWWISDDPALGPEAVSVIDEAAQVFVSVVTPWELGIKRALGKLQFPVGLSGALVRAGMTMLPIDGEHAERAPGLPMHHRDPFDRMLVAQAQIETLRIVTADDVIRRYDVEVIDARR
jgi:PIN domain nuclease of toxin-antitoxin system